MGILLSRAHMGWDTNPNPHLYGSRLNILYLFLCSYAHPCHGYAHESSECISIMYEFLLIFVHPFYSLYVEAYAAYELDAHCLGYQEIMPASLSSLCLTSLSKLLCLNPSLYYDLVAYLVPLLHIYVIHPYLLVPRVYMFLISIWFKIFTRIHLNQCTQVIWLPYDSILIQLHDLNLLQSD